MDEGLMEEAWYPRSAGFGQSFPRIDDVDEDDESPELSPETLAELVELAIASAPRRLLQRFREIGRADQLTLEEVLFDRVRPVANRLGECWLEDTMSFGDVTVGADALQRVMAALGLAAEGPLTHRELVVLTAAPGEQHVLPIHMLSEVVRAEGWATHVDAQMGLEDILDLVSAEEVAAIGITCKDPERLDWLTAHAAAIQAASPTPVSLLIGGSTALESMAQAIGFTYLSTGRALCRRLALRGAIC